MVLYKIRMWEQAKTMDLDKLKRDMFNDPQLMYLNSMAPEELAEHLESDIDIKPILKLRER